MWIKHPRNGKPDAALTVAIYTTVVVLLKVIVCNVKFGDIDVGCVDGGIIAALLTPTWAAYVARKHKEPVKEESKDV